MTNVSQNPVHDVSGLSLEDIGLFFDEKGKLAFNETLFALHVCKHFQLVIADGERIYAYQKGVYKLYTDTDLKRGLCKYFNKKTDNCWSPSYETRYLAALHRLCPKADKLEDGSSYINFANGLLNVETWVRSKHTPKVFTTTQIPVDLNRNGDCPLFKQFLENVFSGNRALIQLAQEAMGYALCSHTKAQKFFVLHGGGANGKSVFLDVVESMVGDENTSHISMSDMGNAFMLAGIVGKRLNISTESSSDYLNTDIIKQISAGESIQINEKYGSPYSYTPNLKLYFAVNKLPYTKDTSYGFARRLVIIPFNVTFSSNPGPEQKMADPHLREKLLQELNGILIFALKGLRRLQMNNFVFTESKESSAALDIYMAIINPYRDFVNALVVADPDGVTPKRDFHLAFLKWIEVEGHANCRRVSARQFYSNLTETLVQAGVCVQQKKLHGGKRVFTGISLNESALRSGNWDTTPDSN